MRVDRARVLSVLDEIAPPRECLTLADRRGIVTDMMMSTSTETFAKRNERGGSDWRVVIGHAYQIAQTPAGALD